TFVHRQERDIDRVKRHSPTVRLNHAQDHAKCRSFPRSVSPQKSHNLPLLKKEADIVDNDTSAVGLNQLCDFEKVHLQGRSIKMRVHLPLLTPPPGPM